MTLTELRRVAEEATQGEWTYEPTDFLPDRVWRGSRQIALMSGDDAETEANAHHIATFDPATVLRLQFAAPQPDAQKAGE